MSLRERLRKLNPDTSESLGYTQKPPAETMYLLYDYPHIFQKVEVLWGTVELHQYLDRLFSETRDGTRKGFPPPVNIALIKLVNIHDDHLKSLGIKLINHEGSEFASRIY